MAISVYSGINRVLFDWQYVVGGGTPFPVWPDNSGTFFEMPNATDAVDSSISKRWSDVSMLWVPGNGLEMGPPMHAHYFSWWNEWTNEVGVGSDQVIYNAIDGVSTQFDYNNEYGEKAFGDFRNLRLTGENSTVPAALMTGYDADGFSGVMNGPGWTGYFGNADIIADDEAEHLEFEGFEIAMQGELRGTFEF